MCICEIQIVINVWPYIYLIECGRIGEDYSVQADTMYFFRLLHYMLS